MTHRWLALPALFGGLCGCAESPPPVAPPRVADVFDVGAGVYVRALTVDPGRDVLWVGTSIGALEIELAGRTVRNTFTRSDGLANEYVFATYVDSKGYTWFGTNAGGVSRYRDGDWRVFFPMHGLADYWVYAFAEAPGGALWIGTWAGANRVDLSTLDFETYHDELVNEWVYGIDVDEDGGVWFGTEGGVSHFDGTRWRAWTHAEGIGATNRTGAPPSTNTGLGTRTRHDLSVLTQGAETYNPSYVFAILISQDGTVWAGTWGGGVATFDGSQWRNLTTADGLAGDIVYSVAESPDGTLWFGTNHGLSRYDGQRFANLGSSDGLPGEDVYAIATDTTDVWVGTRRGVARVVPGAAKEEQ